MLLYEAVKKFPKNAKLLNEEWHIHGGWGFYIVVKRGLLEGVLDASYRLEKDDEVVRIDG